MTKLSIPAAETADTGGILAGERTSSNRPYNAAMFGSHLSIAGGMHNALLKAEELGCETVQVFTKNQKQWKCSPLGDGDVCDWKAHCKRLKFKQTVSHDSYLINLASPNEEIWRKSVELFIEELPRCADARHPVPRHAPRRAHGRGRGGGHHAHRRGAERRARRVAGGEGRHDCLEATAGQGSSLGLQAGAPGGDHRRA